MPVKMAWERKLNPSQNIMNSPIQKNRLSPTTSAVRRRACASRKRKCDCPICRRNRQKICPSRSCDGSLLQSSINCASVGVGRSVISVRGTC